MSLRDEKNDRELNFFFLREVLEGVSACAVREFSEAVHRSLFV